MTTQGAPKNTRTRKTAAAKPNPLVKPATANGADQEMDLDAWMANRGLVGRRRMKVGGEWFEFKLAATAAEVIEHNKARSEQRYVNSLVPLLVDPSQKDAYLAAFDRQLQPILEDDQTALIIAMLNFVIGGDREMFKAAGADAGASTGESSAS